MRMTFGGRPAAGAADSDTRRQRAARMSLDRFIGFSRRRQVGRQTHFVRRASLATSAWTNARGPQSLCCACCHNARGEIFVVRRRAPQEARKTRGEFETGAFESASHLSSVTPKPGKTARCGRRAVEGAAAARRKCRRARVFWLHAFALRRALKLMDSGHRLEICP